MYIKEYEELTITINNMSRTKWSKKLGYEISQTETELTLHWTLLKTSSFRTLFITVKCDDCGKEFERRIRDLILNNNIHYCLECRHIGNRNGHFGKPMNEKTAVAFKKWRDANTNAFTWESTKAINRIKKPWEKAHKANVGSKRNEKTKKKMSDSAIQAFKDGRRKPSSGWGKIYTKEYKNGITYQSSYELKFLKYIDDNNLLDRIENGNVVSYFVNNKEHLYYIDFKIKNTNVVFEIKSTYIWNKNVIINNLKMEAASKIYEYYLILDNNFDNLINIINENI